ncbi:MAG: ComF family protein [Treponema sp.]|nr:ComF family protein [Treponema sp.]
MSGKNLSFKKSSFTFCFVLQCIVQDFISLLLGGERCLRCSKKSLRIPLCKNCLPQLRSFGFRNSCTKCGRELVSEIRICSYCRESPALQSVDGAFSLYGYQLWKKSLLFAWKMEDKRNLSPYFAVLFYEKLCAIENELGFSLAVVPVPPRAGKIRERGWDQIEELCFYLEKGWGVKVFRLLERLSHIQQKKLDRLQRIEGISSSYRLKNKRKIRKFCKKIPEAVVLADDVLTTGSTIEACARELKAFGVRKVFSLTLFIVD